MFVKSFPAAVVAALLCSSAAFAQGRPAAELPPAGYAGQQYIDSRGCTYVRAGHGGQVSWVARIDRSRKQICGQTPTLTTMAEARSALNAESAAPVVVPPAARAPAPPAAIAPSAFVPPPVSYGAPRPLAAGTQTRPAPPEAAPSGPPAPTVARGPNPPPQGPAPTRGLRAPAAAAPPATIGGHPTLVDRRAGCPREVPHGVWYQLSDGRRTLLCSNAPHDLAGAAPVAGGRLAEADQRRPAPGPTVAPTRRGPFVAGYVDPVIRGGSQYQPSYLAGGDLMVPPPGYKAAWQDDRLNPDRGPRSASGEAAMDRLWTRESPQVLRDPPPRPQQAPRVSSRSQPATAPVSAPTRAVPAGARYVQIGSFAQSGNAERAVAAIRALGLPVQVYRTQLRGKSVQVVSAGPFAQPQAASEAQGALRRAGYRDALLRR